MGTKCRLFNVTNYEDYQDLKNIRFTVWSSERLSTTAYQTTRDFPSVNFDDIDNFCLFSFFVREGLLLCPLFQESVPDPEGRVLCSFGLVSPLTLKYETVGRSRRGCAGRTRRKGPLVWSLEKWRWWTCDETRGDVVVTPTWKRITRRTGCSEKFANPFLLMCDIIQMKKNLMY